MAVWKKPQRNCLAAPWLRLLFGFVFLLVGLFIFFYLTLLLLFAGGIYALYTRYRQKKTHPAKGRIIDHDT
jgi:hypothetical protein